LPRADDAPQTGDRPTFRYKREEQTRIVRAAVPQVTVTDDLHKRLAAFKPIVEAVLEEEFDLDSCTEVVLERGLTIMLSDLLGAVEPPVLLASFEQLAAQHPDEVYGFVAETLRTGDAIQREQAKERLGFGFVPSSDE